MSVSVADFCHSECNDESHDCTSTSLVADFNPQRQASSRNRAVHLAFSNMGRISKDGDTVGHATVRLVRNETTLVTVPLPGDVELEIPTSPISLIFNDGTERDANFNIPSKLLEDVALDRNVEVEAFTKTTCGWEVWIALDFEQGTAELLPLYDARGPDVGSYFLKMMILRSDVYSETRAASQPSMYSDYARNKLSCFQRALLWMVLCVDILVGPVRWICATYHVLKWTLSLWLLSLPMLAVAFMQWAGQFPTIFFLAAEVSVTDSATLGVLVFLQHTVLNPVKQMANKVSVVIETLVERWPLLSKAEKIHESRKEDHWESALSKCKDTLQGKSRRSCSTTISQRRH